MYVPLLTVGPLEFGPVAWHRSSFVPPARSSSAVRCTLAARVAPLSLARPSVSSGQWRPACVLWRVYSGQCGEDLSHSSKTNGCECGFVRRDVG